ncbi:uncharacterized protein T551_00379 [Pneumocystis jirovecii RU7]|uniref:FCP1 homology domain-containing protein n=1 Tax=Pneumocystis jirovecii (strain RU7) TaxID=1408657 RepID=A0A0W4ZVA9_PNEJ7|nr:uncharacterized protein T551_00379 [Pneumocystis jirovecii RU7]KTW32288.1 hypothetical protein T551_00379 [Pneumocystis jirovecii RU7]
MTEQIEIIQESDEHIVLQEIPPRSMSTESIKQTFTCPPHKKKRIFILKLQRKKLSRTFFHFFMCCISPNKCISKENEAENGESPKTVTIDVNLLPEGTENDSLIQDTQKDILLEEENIGILQNLKGNLNEETDFNTTEIFPLTDQDPIYRERKVDISLIFSQIDGIENGEAIQHPLSPNISTEIDLSLSLINSPLSMPHTENQQWLLSPILDADKGKKCLVLDLDETLVHSSFKIIHQADFIIPIKIDSIYHNVYVIKRPGVDCFMKRMGELFEIVVFTASLAKYADPVLDMLDIHHVVKHRLFRESCFNHQGNYVKNLSQLGRELKNVLIIDNSPASYIFHSSNAIPVSSWFNDIHDTELLDLIPFLEDLTTVSDVTTVLDLALA